MKKRITKKEKKKILPSYICDIQEINNLSKVMFMSNFPHHQFILCTSGTGKICTENNIEQTVSKGDIIFINSSILFSLRQQNFSIKRIAFNGNFVYKIISNTLILTKPLFLFRKATTFLTHLILRMTAICTIKTIYKILLICTILSVYAVKVMFHQNPLF